MNIKNGMLVLLTCVILLPLAGHAQRGMWDGAYNRLGLQAGMNHFNINTDELPVTARTSWTAGFTTRSSFYDNFQFIYGINFFDFKTQVTGREKIDYSTANEEIDYNMIGVQANFFGSYKILGHHLSVEMGPVLQVNGKYEPRQDKELWYVDGYDLTASDISKVSTFNVNFAVGISGGFEKLKFWTQYQHGLNNFFAPLNSRNLEEIDPTAPEFKGRIGMITAGVAMFL